MVSVAKARLQLIIVGNETWNFGDGERPPSVTEEAGCE